MVNGQWSRHMKQFLLTEFWEAQGFVLLPFIPGHGQILNALLLHNIEESEGSTTDLCTFCTGIRTESLSLGYMSQLLWQLCEETGDLLIIPYTSGHTS
jgi:hypothetical protein